MKDLYKIIIVGAVIGVIALVLTAQGNPPNMGFCGACFIRDTAGAMGFHRAEAVQYVRPEIIGIVFGAFLFGLFTKRSNVQGGSSPITRFVLGICVMIGALIFLGCPLRMVLRIAGGDLNAVVGLVGFVLGIAVGIFFLKRGFSLGKTQQQKKVEGYPFILINLLIIGFFILVPSLFFFSTEGPGSMHAPIILSLVAGLIIGAIAFSSKFCFSGGIRDLIMFKDYGMLIGILTVILVVGIGNMIMGNFHLGFENQPIAHTNWFFNIGGLFIVGFASTMLSGCPLRQLVLAGSGNVDSVVTVIGLFVGAALAHNFQLASTPDGPSDNGQIAFWIVLAIMFAIAILNSKLNKKN